MALNVSKLQSDIESLLRSMSEVSDSEAGYKQFSSGLASLIDSYIKTADVTVDPGIPVSTAGTAISQTGATVAIGSGRLS